MWMAHSGVTTRCGVTVGLPPQACKPSRRVARTPSTRPPNHLRGRRDTPIRVPDRTRNVTPSHGWRLPDTSVLAQLGRDGEILPRAHRTGREGVELDDGRDRVTGVGVRGEPGGDQPQG